MQKGSFFRVEVPFEENDLLTWEEVEKVTKEQNDRIAEIEELFFSEDASIENKAIVEKYQKFLDGIYGKEKVKVKERINHHFIFSVLNGYDWKENELIEKMIRENMQWRIEFKGEEIYEKPSILSERLKAIEALENQFCFNFGYSKNKDPILWVKLRDYKAFMKPKNKGAYVKEIINYLTFVMIDIEKHQMKGKKRITMIVDAKGIGTDLIKAAVKVGKEMTWHSYQFIDILHNAIIINSGFILRGLWKVVSLFLDDITKSKYLFLKKLDGLKKYVDESNIPKEFGGSQEFNYSISSHIKKVEEENKARKLIHQSK